MNYLLPVLLFLALSLNNCARYTLIPDDAPLRAIGNEPYWSLSIANNTIVFQQLGQEPCNFSFRNTKGQHTYQASGPCGSITINFTNAPCSDKMSDTAYPYTVSIQLNNHIFSGCGFKSLPKPTEPQ